MKYLPSRLPAVLLTLIVGVCASSTAFAADIVIQNADAAGVGFNDPTPATPVGGNPGTTVGEQRLKAFEFAASIWGSTLTSGPTITIRASWSTTMECTSNSAVLGSAGAINIHHDFSGAPFAQTWYPASLANALHGTDLSSSAEIAATFNSKIGTPGCFETRGWYYGLDNSHGPKFDLVAVLLHEFGHGLGFQTFTKSDTGVQSSGLPSIYDRFLFDNTSGKTWVEMTDAERVSSAINFQKLAWKGPQVAADTPSIGFIRGLDSAGRPLMYTPATLEKGSSVSHWDTDESPNQLMEPDINPNLTHSVAPPQDLTFSVMKDIGWCSGCPPPPPPPPPTPTPTVAPNNNFVNAQTISGCTGSVSGHNFGATREGGEPSHDPAGDPGGGSVWYQWQAPGTGSVTMTTAGSDYDTLLAIYTGNSVGGLTSIIKNDDVDPGNIRTSTVTFDTIAGTLYKIAVDGWDNERGNIVLNWNASNCGAANPIDGADFFVTQQYLDFLNRQPDASGLAFWSGQITACGNNQGCIQDRRVNVSAAFFLSIEFQETGFLVYKMNKAAFGNLSSPPNAPVPVRFAEFQADSRQIANGVIVDPNNNAWRTLLDNNKVAFANDFVTRSAFSSAYSTTLTPAQFVDALIARAGFTPTPAQRDAFIAEFGGAGDTANTTARARALRDIAENPTFHQQELNRAFVLMEYFGYLRRNPYDPPELTLDYAGYNFWLTKLNQFNGDFKAAEMVNAFITSIEYRQRFGP